MKLFIVKVTGEAEDGYPKVLARHGPFCLLKAEQVAVELACEMHRQMGGFNNKKVASVSVEES